MRRRAVARAGAADAARDDATPTAKRARRRDDARATPEISVLMPTRNAMPWLAMCVESVLTQRDVALELVVGDDGSDDGSREWLLALERALDARASARDDGRAIARAMPDAADGTFDAMALTGDATRATTRTPEAVARAASKTCELRVLTLDRAVGRETPSGQGRALNACFEASRGALVGEMESDDLRPPDAFRTLADALAANETWDAATSRIALCGTAREGMARFERWQNGLLEPRELARERFIEIPALRASALFRRAALDALRAETPEGRLYRDFWRVDDERVLDFATCARGTPAPDARPHRWWPVDSDFWHRWFHHGFTAGKVPRALYYWRQYDAQSTRTHARCSLEQLRRCKAYFLVAAALEGQFSSIPVREIRVYSVGDTLRAWSEAARREVACQRPRRRSRDVPDVVVVARARTPAEICAPGFLARDVDANDAAVLRVFAFGAARPRARVAAAIAALAPPAEFPHVFVA